MSTTPKIQVVVHSLLGVLQRGRSLIIESRSRKSTSIAASHGACDNTAQELLEFV
jgi:hypothetical protein